VESRRHNKEIHHRDRREHGARTERNDEVGTMNDEVKKSCLTSSFIVPRSYFLLCAPSVLSPVSVVSLIGVQAQLAIEKGRERIPALTV
jgi:hypothetical protein